MLFSFMLTSFPKLPGSRRLRSHDGIISILLIIILIVCQPKGLCQENSGKTYKFCTRDLEETLIDKR